MRKVLLAIVAILLITSIGLSCTEEYPLPGDEPELPETLCTIIRDNYGVPHIFADTKEGLGYGAGYAMAQDRLWQADVLRRAATGRLAELGLATIEEDIATRTLWYGEDELLKIYDDWDPGEGYEYLKPMIEAYVDGINAYIDQALSNLYVYMPAEYMAQNLVPYLEPFTVADVVGLTVLMGWRFGGTGGNEGDLYEALLTLQAMHGDTAGAAIWDDLFPLDDAGAPVTIPSESLTALSTDGTSLDVPDNLSLVLEQAQELWATQDEVFESLGVPTKFGSNAVLVSPELSATGNALELGGPQMGYTMPQIVYELGLHGAGINAVGMAMPCAGPFILIGVSEHGAWTSTTGSSDVMDVRILTLNPANPTQYWHKGEWVDMERRNELVYGPKKQTYQATNVYRSVYGPIISMDLDAGTAVTLHTPFFKNEIAGEQGWQLFQAATNIDEFEAAVELVVPSHNFYWADTEGNIGYWHAGRFPVKPAGADRRLPLAGDGTQEWVRVTSQYEIPRDINPEQGWLINWNNKPIAGWPYAESDVHWGEGFRVQILMDAMATFAASGDLTTDTLNTLNQVAGYHSTEGMNFAVDLIAALNSYVSASPDPELYAALGQLGAWAMAEPLPVSRVDLVSPAWPYDPNPTYDHPGLTIFNAWYDRFVPAVFDGILPASLIDQVKGRPSLLLRVLRGDASLLYPGYPTGAALDTLVVNALKDAINDLEIEYGSSDMATWLTPVRMQSYDAQGALPGGKIHPYMNRGTYNQIAEMVAEGLPNAKNVIPPGQSGLVVLPGVPSPYVADQVPLYASWTYKPMLFTRQAVEAVKTWQRVFLVE
ncbi:MAG: penicillin acylase family protein [Dehalococcoidia bacterium]